MTNMKAKQMKKTLSVFLGLFFALAVFAGSFLPTAAAGTTQIGFSKKSVTVGDSFSVTVRASASSSITLKFSSSVVTLTDAGGGSASGNAVSFTGTALTARFTASAAGKADFIVSSTDGLVSGSSASLNVAAAAAEAPAQPETPAAETPADTQPQDSDTQADTQPQNADAQTTDGAETSAAAEAPADTAAAPANADISYDGAWYAVSERYSDSMIPAGFSKTMVAVGTKNVSELSNGTYTLVYLKAVSADGTIADAGSFFFYDPAAGTVTGPVEMIGTADAYVIAADSADNPYANVMTQASFDYSNASGTVTIDKAYVLNGAGEGYYYIYGFKPEGQATWYRYCIFDDTVQTADLQLLANVSSAAMETPADEDSSADAPNEGTTSRNIRILKVVLLVIIVLVVLLIVLNLLPGKKREEEDAYDDSDFDEEDDDDDGEEEPEDEGDSLKDAPAASKTAAPAASKTGETQEKEEETPVSENAPLKEETASEKTRVLPDLSTEISAAAAETESSAAVKTAPEEAPSADPAAEAQAARQKEEEKSKLYWARKNFYNGKTGALPSSGELLFGEKPLPVKEESSSSDGTKGKKDKNQKGPDSGDSGEGGSSIDVIDLNDL